MYESFNTYGYVQDELLNIKISIQTPDMLTNLKYIKIGSNNYKTEIKEISDVLLDEENLINYQMVKLKIDERLNNNQVFEICIFYNEEKVLGKTNWRDSTINHIITNELYKGDYLHGKRTKKPTYYENVVESLVSKQKWEDCQYQKQRKCKAL